MMTTFGLSDLRQAARLVQGSSTIWRPPESVVLVLSAHGGAGGSTVALSVATAAGAARVVECCTVSASGLAGASTAELGGAGNWQRGSRGPVLIDRLPSRITSAMEIPVPAECDVPLTIVDCSTDPDVIAHSGGWLGDLVRKANQLIIVARPSMPGLRRLEAGLDVLGDARCSPVLVGVSKWSRALDQMAGHRLRALYNAGLVVTMPFDPGLAQQGLSTDPLPAAVVAVGSNLNTNRRELL